MPCGHFRLHTLGSTSCGKASSVSAPLLPSRRLSSSRTAIPTSPGSRLLRFLFLCLLALSATTPLTSETFRNPRRILTDSDPIGLKVADLNNDGLPDIIYG